MQYRLWAVRSVGWTKCKKWLTPSLPQHRCSLESNDADFPWRNPKCVSAVNLEVPLLQSCHAVSAGPGSVPYRKTSSPGSSQVLLPAKTSSRKAKYVCSYVETCTQNSCAEAVWCISSGWILNPSGFYVKISECHKCTVSCTLFLFSQCPSLRLSVTTADSWNYSCATTKSLDMCLWQTTQSDNSITLKEGLVRSCLKV